METHSSLISLRFILLVALVNVAVIAVIIACWKKK